MTFKILITATSHERNQLIPAMSVPATSSAPPATILIPCSSPAAELDLSTVGFVTSFRNHPQVVAASRLFSSVVLKSVSITIAQLTIPSSDEAYTRLFTKFGIIPRDTNFVDPATKSSVVSYLPHLKSFATSLNPIDLTVTWGDGGIPFPPGLQLDLRATEMVNNYPVAFFGHTDLNLDKQADSIASMALDFSVECSVQGFGAVY